MIDFLKIKPLHELPIKFKKVDGEWCFIDEGVYIVDEELCCTQRTYNILLNDPEEREKFNATVIKFIKNGVGRDLMIDYLKNDAVTMMEVK